MVTTDMNAEDVFTVAKQINTRFITPEYPVALAFAFLYLSGQHLLFRIHAYMWNTLPKCTCDK